MNRGKVSFKEKRRKRWMKQNVGSSLKEKSSVKVNKSMNDSFDDTDVDGENHSDDLSVSSKNSDSSVKSKKSPTGPNLDSSHKQDAPNTNSEVHFVKDKFDPFFEDNPFGRGLDIDTIENFNKTEYIEVKDGYSPHLNVPNNVSKEIHTDTYKKRLKQSDSFKINVITNDIRNSAPPITTRSEKEHRKLLNRYLKNDFYDFSFQERDETMKEISNSISDYLTNESNPQKLYDAHVALERIKMRFLEVSKEKFIQMSLMKGQIDRRDKVIEEQRIAYLKELYHLREQLFQQKGSSPYRPYDAQFRKWYNKDDKLENEGLKYMNDKLLIKEKKKLKEEANKEKSKMINMLKIQTEQVGKTLVKLKKLEDSKKEEFEKQKESEIENEKLKEKILELEKEAQRYKHLIEEGINNQNPLPSLTKLPKIERNIQTDEVPVIKEEKPLQSPKKSDTNGSYLSLEDHETESDLDESNLDKYDENNDSIRTSTDSMSDKVSVADTEALSTLENQIEDFQDRFSGLFTEMDSLKKRLGFYEEARVVEVEEPNGPEGFVTLVFTDVQDSTRLWELDAQAMEAALKVHNSEIRRILKENNGFEVKTEGDAFMCAFSSTLDAVEFAMHVQIELVSAEWPNEILKQHPARVELDEYGEVVWRGLRVRMGIHAGRPIVEQDPVTGRSDYFGPMVNRSARVEGQARGGEVMISSSVWAEIETFMNSFSVAVWTKYIGPVTLKGMDTPETIRLILPEKLKNRKFAEKSPQPSSSVDLIKNQLDKLKKKHELLEKQKKKIESKIQNKLKIRILEETLKEKENVVEYMREKLREMKITYKKSLITQNDKQRKIMKDQKKVFENSINDLVQKYEKLNTDYSKTKKVYETNTKKYKNGVNSEMEELKKQIDDLTTKLETKESIHQRSIKQIEELKSTVSKKNNQIVKNKKAIGSLKSGKSYGDLDMDNDFSDRNTSLKINMSNLSEDLKNSISQAMGLISEFEEFSWKVLVKRKNVISYNGTSNDIKSMKNQFMIYNEDRDAYMEITNEKQIMSLPTKTYDANQLKNLRSESPSGASFSRLLAAYDPLASPFRRSTLKTQNPSYGRNYFYSSKAMNAEEVDEDILARKFMEEALLQEEEEESEHQEDPKYFNSSLLSKEKRNLPFLNKESLSLNEENKQKVKKWISVVVEKEGHLAKKFKKFNVTKDQIKDVSLFKHLSKEEKREEVLKMLYLDRNNHRYQISRGNESFRYPEETKPASKEDNNVKIADTSIEASNVLENEQPVDNREQFIQETFQYHTPFEQQQILNRSFTEDPSGSRSLTPALKSFSPLHVSSIDHYLENTEKKRESINTELIKRSIKNEIIWNQSSSVRRLIGIKTSEQHRRAYSSMERRNIQHSSKPQRKPSNKLSKENRFHLENKQKINQGRSHTSLGFERKQPIDSRKRLQSSQKRNRAKNISIIDKIEQEDSVLSM